MTNSMPSTVSNAKARANEKLFGKKEAHSLQSNLFREIKSYWPRFAILLITPDLQLILEEFDEFQWILTNFDEKFF